ncbi:MAG: GAF domain-containing protein [Balneolia bacterium]|nr:GAF domain-containing protein [Balneolia bacterium]
MSEDTGSGIYSDFNLIDRQREERALKRFKKAVEQMVTLLRVSTNTHTAYVYWINRSRGQFVLESAVTVQDNVVFDDRMPIEHHFLSEWTELEETTMLYSGAQFDPEDLVHHTAAKPTESLIIIPFKNNDETVALTVIEQANAEELHQDQLYALEAYQEALTNILKTYLELSDMLGEESQWIAFDEVVKSFSDRFTRYTLFRKLLNECAKMVPGGGAVLVTRGMESWNAVLKAGDASSAIRLGMKMSENSQVNRALKTGESQFSLHFNGNPKRLNASESRTEGASIAVPIEVHDRRQAVLLVWDENPLVFRESVKHMVTTMARLTGLHLSQTRYRISSDEDSTSTESGAYTIELMEHALECQIGRYKEKKGVPSSWLVFVSPKDYQSLRTSHRLERLKHMQQEMAIDLNPNLRGLAGFVSFYSDSLFVVYIQAEEEHLKEWLQGFSQQVAEKASSGRNYVPGMDFYIGSHRLSFEKGSAYDVIQEAKQIFNQSVKQEITLSKI